MKINVEKKHIKNMYMRIRNGEVYVSAPYYLKDEEIKKFVESRKDKLIEALNKPFSLWGKTYEIENILDKKNYVEVLDKVYVHYTKDENKVLNAFLAKEVKKEVDIIVEKYYAIMQQYDILYKEISIKKMCSRWGSCKTKERKISLNSELAKYDKRYLEYVFCHEIAHIKHADHSKNFHMFLETIFPEEKKVRKELKKNC